MDLRNYYINESETILAAIETIEKNHSRNIFIVNDKEKIVGLISQGDIVRGILAGIELHCQCRQILNSNFIYLGKRDMRKAYKIFKKKNITLMPIIDKEFRLVDVITLDDIFEYLEDG